MKAGIAGSVVWERGQIGLEVKVVVTWEGG